MSALFLLAVAAVTAATQPESVPAVTEPVQTQTVVEMTAPAPSPLQIVPEGTPIRLMVLHEITSRTGHAGDKFVLRVDEPVYINGKPVIPVGAKAWGEVISVNPNGAVGKGGRLGAKLLYVELSEGKLPLRGTIDSKGDGNGAGVVLAVVGFGILGLLNAGDSARLKGGQTFTAYVDKAN